jgi:hypothetical protein
MDYKEEVPEPGKAINRFSEFAKRIASGEMPLPASLEDGNPINNMGPGCQASWDDSWDQWNNSWSQEFDNSR